MEKTFDKTYRVGSNEIRVKLKYNLIYTTHELDMDVLDMGKLEFGYEDEDQLTFYPNIMKLEFDDFERKNYYTLKFAFHSTPAGNFEDNHSGEIYYNSRKVFEGYIDKKTLKYDEDTMRINFEMVDYSIRLKQKSVVNNPGPQDWAGGISDIIQIYKEVYPALDFNITQDISEYNSNSFNGMYFRHNWVFKGNGTTGVPEFNVSWGDPDGWAHVHLFRQRLYEKSNYYTDLLKNYAKEFGMTIGSGGINKVYAVKRFIDPANFSPRNITDKVTSLNKEIWLENIVGVRNIPENNPDPPTNIRIEGSFVTIDGYLNGKPKDADNVIDFRSLLTRNQGNNNVGAPNIRVSQGSYVQTVLNGIYDPDLAPASYRSIEDIITRYTYLTRIKPKDKYELELSGIDYYIHEYCKLEFADIPSVALRPLKVSIDLLKEVTVMQALEVGI